MANNKVLSNEFFCRGLFVSDEPRKVCDVKMTFGIVDVFIKEPTASDMLAHHNAHLSKNEDTASMERAKLISKHIVNEDGSRMMTVEDALKLPLKNAVALFNGIMHVAADTKEARDELGESSTDDQTTISGT